MTDLSGQSFGRYHLIEKLGEGGMAVVYKAFDTRLECDVAVKVIRLDNLPRSKEEITLKRFEREAKAVAQLSHPNIIRVIDYGDQDGMPFLVMPYLSGGTLKQFLGQPMNYVEAAKLLVPIADALYYAHQHNVIHRDVKPSNILVSDSGQPMIADFGIAKVLDVEDGQTLTSTGVGIGTPEYMAPEQWTGNISPSVDIYSLGVVFYELVTGRKPYTADTPAAVLLKSVNDPLPKPSSLVGDLPKRVERVIYKSLAKKPENRYEKMIDFSRELKSFIGQEKTTLISHPRAALPSETDSLQTKIDSAEPTSENLTAQHNKNQVLPQKSDRKAPDRKKLRFLWIGLAIILILGISLTVILGKNLFSKLALLPTNTPTFTITPRPSATNIPPIIPSAATTATPKLPSPTATEFSLPDLMINDFKNYIYSDGWHVCVEVRNEGYAASGDFQVKINMNGEIDIINFSSMPPFQVKTECVVTHTFVGDKSSCSFTTQAWVDYQNQIYESNENNNYSSDFDSGDWCY